MNEHDIRLDRRAVSRRKLLTVGGAMLVGATSISLLPSIVQGREDPVKGSHSVKAAAFHDAMRKLWEDHITWTRLFIVSAAGDLPDKQATTERLLQNQVDIGTAIKPYYGNENGDKLTTLLKEHITIAADLVASAKANDQAKVADAKTRWIANADQISAFLSGANPKNWPAPEMKRMMREHLDLTTAEATARLNKDWKADIVAYERVHEQILHMADMLSDGITKQFPQQFT